MPENKTVLKEAAVSFSVEKTTENPSFDLLELFASHISGIIICLAIFFAIFIIYILIKKFLCDKQINSKTFSIYNEIMYYKRKKEFDKVSYALMDYLGFRVSEEEVKFILATSQNTYMFFKFRKRAGARKIKFEDGKYLLKDKLQLTKWPNFFFILGTILFSFYLSFSFDLFIKIENQKDFILLSVYVLCITIPMMISSYISILENNAAEELINYKD